ncbi:hypothetical protein LCGC14_1769920 [marine sediment metagenome]|uniref:NadR/Ttd14 AAA domain-containing protein n=1 Tax=marine sediment metagenome TaxID=412755 RepID=A0A0F9JYA6_9ZZZZ
MTRLPDISLSGPMRSGKTTCQDYLVQTYGYTPMSFAYAIKVQVARGINTSLHASDLDREPLKSRVRGILQYWGNEFRRKEDPDYWVGKLSRRLWQTKEDDPDTPVVIADTRFKNELALLKGRGFTTVKLEMSQEDVYKYFQESDGPTLGRTEFQGMMLHDSEHDLDEEEFDVILESKRGKVEDLLKRLDTNLMVKSDGGEDVSA